MFTRTPQVRAALAGVALWALCAQGAAAQPVQLTVAADRPGPVIARQVYGQFTEHLGQGVYGGLWVGPGSAIPNVRGWRQDVVQALKRLQVPVLRWPGGCFADEYHWRDGIGPRARRPVRINGNWGGVAEPNAVGSHEFFDLVEQLGAEAYLTGNLGSGSTQELAEWLEYLTADGPSSLARERRRNGRTQPFRVHYFGVGNESWGCGGNMRPEHYVDLYRQTTTFLKTPADRAPKFIASGGFEQDTTWAEVLSRDIRGVFEDIGPKMAGISHHAYTFPGGDFAHKGPATGFGTADWVSTLRNPQRIGEARLRVGHHGPLKGAPQRRLFGCRALPDLGGGAGDDHQHLLGALPGAAAQRVGEADGLGAGLFEPARFLIGGLHRGACVEDHHLERCRAGLA